VVFLLRQVYKNHHASKKSIWEKRVSADGGRHPIVFDQFESPMWGIRCYRPIVDVLTGMLKTLIRASVQGRRRHSTGTSRLLGDEPAYAKRGRGTYLLRAKEKVSHRKIVEKGGSETLCYSENTPSTIRMKRLEGSHKNKGAKGLQGGAMASRQS